MVIGRSCFLTFFIVAVESVYSGEKRHLCAKMTISITALVVTIDAKVPKAINVPFISALLTIYRSKFHFKDLLQKENFRNFKLTKFFFANASFQHRMVT